METFWTLYRPTAVISLRGEDSAAFVQSQFSGDVRGGPGRAAVGLWLDHRAGIHGVSTVLHREAEVFLLVSVDTPAEQIVQKLEAHIIADDVFLEDQTAKWAGVFLSDEAMLAAIHLSSPGPRTALNLDSGVLLLPSHRFEEGWELVGPCEAIESSWMARLQATGIAEIDERALKEQRLRRGWPRVPAEVGKTETPSEAGLLAFCSLEKGCYLGQEVVNRQARLDRSARHLVVVEGDGACPEPGCEILEETKPVGELRSSMATGNGWMGRALVKSSVLARKPRLALSGGNAIRGLDDGE